jgi:hypothetical protein
VATPDQINALFEGIGSILIWKSITKLHREKIVRGVHWAPITFFGCWGLWNIYYYNHLNQWFSWIAGMSMVIANAIWIGQLFYYNWTENKNKHLAWNEATDEYMGL